jgi:hypothetical protein
MAMAMPNRAVGWASLGSRLGAESSFQLRRKMEWHVRDGGSNA